MSVDLHIHTTASDGSFSSETIVRAAHRNGLSAIAITDHDTMNGVEQAVSAAELHGIEVIRGIEFSADMPDDEIHILGYFDSPVNNCVQTVLTELREKRILRAREILRKLEQVNIVLSIEDVLKFTGDSDYIGRPHIAMAMLEKGYVKNRNEAFSSYLTFGLPGFADRDNGLDIISTVGLIRDNNGIAVIAHPGLIKNRRYFDLAIECGVNGVEVFHPSHDNDTVQELLDFSMKKGLIVTGGSDYHGHGDKFAQLGAYSIDYSYFCKLKGAF